MALTAAEKQRLYRQRRDSDPRKRSQYLLKEKDRYKQKKEYHKIRPISQLSSREKRAQRKIWRVAQQRSREQRKIKANSPSTKSTPSRQKLSGKKAKKRNYAACYRQIAQLKDELNDQKRLTERYRKQCTRMKTGFQEIRNTPNSKTKAMLRGSVVTEQIRRELLFHNTIVEHLKQKYKSGRKEREKQVIAKILTGKIVKKYKMQGLAQKRFGFSKRRWQRSGATSIDFERKKRVYKLTDDVKGSTFNFFIRDDVSRVTTGKKDTITRNSRKEQKRFLTDSLKNLHTKFLAENPNNLSYSSFCSLRPFWVLHPSTSDRETCLCKKHENTSFQAAKLHQLKVIGTVDVEQLALALNCCDETCKGCSYEDCDECKDKKLGVNLIDGGDESCFCSFEKNYCCDCFAMKKFNFSSRNITDGDQETVDIVPVDNARAFSDLIGKWCVALYDNEPYPGIIQSFDETDVEIKVMHRVGNNRFFWPAREDILWYGYNQVLSLIPKPKEVTSRHVEVEPRLWDLIRANLR